MNIFPALLHLIQFVLPAIFVGGLVALLAYRILRISAKRTLGKIVRQWLINSLSGIAALSIGLIAYTVDGKMMTYAFMLIACAVSQWLQLPKASGAGRK